MNIITPTIMLFNNICYFLLWLGVTVIENSVFCNISSFSGKDGLIYTLSLVSLFGSNALNLFKREKILCMFSNFAATRPLLEMACKVFIVLLRGQI